ncbi:hypothetical protein Tco_0859312 [Tanacetum coccineum]|uniref:No apical meristem-associated C-terminal domain-containing protein n=1 Tax=Tanacetum coccineum TaxID=301880 RepID=A0ABQ5BBM5_9ASTR
MHGSALVHDDEDNSPAGEVSPVKPKKPSKRAAKTKKDDPKEGKEAPKEWTVAEETALCQGWCDVSENSISGNSMKAKGFWKAVIQYFREETGSTRANHESGTNDLDVYHKACAEYKMIYKGDFNLEHCYNILKDHPVSGGINLNDEADEAVEETQEFRPMGRDRAKAKKKAAGSSREGASSFVDLVADKFYNMKQKKWGKKDKEQQSYIELKNRELSIREAEAREIAQLKKEKLEIQRRTLELAEREKRDKYILFYNSVIDPNLPPIQQQKLLEMKMKIKARYNLDY